MQRIAAILTLVGCLLVGGLAYSVQGVGAIAGNIGLTIQCNATPETTRVTNNTDEGLNLAQFRLDTLVADSPGEPFPLSGTLAPGQSAIFQSGGGAGTGITGAFIYNNDDPNEGARLITPFGDLTVLCSVGSGILTVADTATTTTTTTARATTTTSAVTTTTAPAATTTTTTRAATTTTAAAPMTTTTTATTPMPGLPNTGGGGMAGGGTSTLPLAALAALMVTLAGGGALVARRQ